MMKPYFDISADRLCHVGVESKTFLALSEPDLLEVVNANHMISLLHLLQWLPSEFGNLISI